MRQLERCQNAALTMSDKIYIEIRVMGTEIASKAIIEEPGADFTKEISIGAERAIRHRMKLSTETFFRMVKLESLETDE